MRSVIEFLRERARQLGVGDRGIVFAGAALVVAATAGAIWVYTTVTQPPPEAGVLPLAPGAFVQGEFLVQFKPGAPAEEIRNLNAQRGARELGSIPGVGISKLEVPPGFSVGDMVAFYEKNPNVVFAEPNYEGELDDSPNDPAWVSTANPHPLWALKKILADQAWDISQGSSSVIIAVLDSGALAGHEDLAPKITGQKNVKTGTTDVTDTSTIGHGTRVAGIAGAATGNSKGMAGMCRLCPIMPVRVTGDDNSLAAFDVAQGIYYAMGANAKIISMSLVFSYGGLTLQKAVNDALAAGVTVVAASGNNNASTVLQPAAYPGVLSVGATDQNDALWVSSSTQGSNYGPPLLVVAPGVSIYSSVKSGASAYGSGSGTSYATPLVAGLAGLIRSANLGLSNAEVVSIITSTAKDLGTAGRDDQYGYGRIDALAALQKATGATSTLQQQTVATPTATTGAATATPAPTGTVSAQSAATATPVPTATTASAATATPVPTATTAPAATATPVPTATPSGPATVTEAFSGSLDQRRGPAQVDHTISVSAAGAISASLNWGGGADLDLLLLNPAGQQVASATGKSKPQNLSFNATATGTYTLRVVAVSGSASYTLSATHP